MPQFEINQGPIRVLYGVGVPVEYVFLTVFDERLETQLDASDEVNDISTTHVHATGSGIYLSLRTRSGSFGLGIEVDDSTMATYLARYGVPAAKIAEFPLSLPCSHQIWKELSPDDEGSTQTADRSAKTGICSSCKKPSSLSCGKCHRMPYCSRACQRANWKIHKVFCGMETSPSKLNPNNSVLGVLLPQNGDRPSFIRVAKRRPVDEDYEHLDVSNFFLDGSIRSDWFPRQKQRALKCSYTCKFKDDFLVDGVSQNNMCIAKLLLDPRSSPRWRGDVFVFKGSRDREPVYEDMAESDIKDAVEFLQDYTEWFLSTEPQ